MSLDTANAQDYGAQPPRRGLFSRLRGGGKTADAFGSAAAEDPFAFADDDARFRRRRRILGLILVLALLGAGGGIAAYLHFAPPPEDTPPVAESGGNRVVQPMPPVPGPEALDRALIAPPGAANPDADRRSGNLAAQPPQAAPQPAPQPQAAPAPQAAPKPVQSVAMPDSPSPRLDREAASKPVRFADLPRVQAPAQPALAAAPVAELQRRTPGGLVIPTVGPDGRRPYQVYARPFTGDAKAPKIAVVVAGLGLSHEATAAAIEATPPGVTLAFDVAAAQLAERMAAARRAGHETLLELGMQSEAFPAVDPGPGGLLAVLSPAENATRLEHALAAAPVYVGVLARGGDAYAASASHAAALMTTLRQAGLAFVSAVPFASADAYPARAPVDVAIPAGSFRELISARLQQAEAVARARGGAVVEIAATPLALAQLLPWIGGLTGRGFELAPISAVVKE